MNVFKICQEYCIGCGLCYSERCTEMKKNKKGYLVPSFTQSTADEDFLKRVCPVLGFQDKHVCPENIWGKSLGVYAGFSKDPVIREKASSGGMLTSIALYLLESGKIDAVIQIKKKNNSPTETECCVCSTSEDVLKCCGSRYAISSPWLKIDTQLDPSRKYAAVGKPCDIAAMRNLQEQYGKYKNIEYLLSFFCAGIPSEQANDKLISALGCSKKTCKDLTYRGNGWPGKTTAVDAAGNPHQMDYAEAWGGILGRDVHPYCRLCIDGIGAAADIACGDGWYVSSEGKPDFSEHDGRNVVFARTPKGKELLDSAVRNNAVVLQTWPDMDTLPVIQKYQYTRRATMLDKILAYKLAGKKVPAYSSETMKVLAANGTFGMHFRVFGGTVKRILKHKI